MDLVTVVFQDELDQLRQQAKSIDLYCQDLEIDCIYVMLNGPDLQHQIDPAWYGGMADRVRLIDRGVYGCAWSPNGWLSQQVLKLYGAALSCDTWCMVLDAKTILVKPALRQDIIGAGRPHVGSFGIQPVFEPSLEIAQNLFGVRMSQQLGPAGVPAILHPATVRAMIADVELRTDRCFADWFQAQGMLTEFILYSAYLIYRYNGFDQLYHPENHIHCVNICHSEVNSFDRKIDLVDDQTLTVSVHRRAWPSLSQAQQARFVQLLQDRGIA